MPQSEGGYKKFKIGELFNVDETWIYGKNKQYDTREQKYKEGFFPVVSGITANNGINYYTNDKLLPEEIFNDSLTISTRGVYSGTVTYHDGAFCLANNILVMATPPKWSRRAKLYLGALIAKLGYGGYYGYPRKETLKQDTILLPVTKNGDIDFNYIELFVKGLEQKQVYEHQISRAHELELYKQESGLKDYILTPNEIEILKCSKDFQLMNIGSIFEKPSLPFKKKVFNKRKDISTERTSEFDLPLVNAKHGQNGIMYYGREQDFDSIEMGIDIVNDGAVSTGDVYPQPQKTGVLYNAYLIRFKDFTPTDTILMFMAAVIEKSIKLKFSYQNKAGWEKVKDCLISVPVTADGSIDYAFMENYINAIKKITIARVEEDINREYNAYLQIIESQEDLTGEPTIEPTITPLHIHDTYQPGRIPLYTLRAACGYFDVGQLPEEEGWIDATGQGFTPDKDRYFAVHAKGDSMLPKIHDGDICVFEWYHAGSRNGEIVLTQSSEYDDAYGGRYTIKRYLSEKIVSDEGWQHAKVELQPLNPDFAPIVLSEDDPVRTIGIFKCVLD